MQYTTFTDNQIDTMVGSINSNGYAVLPGWASRTQLVELEAWVSNKVADAGNSYVALNGQNAVAGSVLYEWGNSPVFIDLCQRVVTRATGRPPIEPCLHQVLRCLIGDRGQQESLIFHYDSFVLTTIMPVCMPANGDPGDLLMLPNHRPLRRTYFFNLIDKLRVDNRWVQRRLKRGVAAGGEKFTQIRMNPGDLYLFWGYRSLHTNLPADPTQVRATAVFHYDHLHANSSLASGMRRALGFLKPLPPVPVADAPQTRPSTPDPSSGH